MNERSELGSLFDALPDATMVVEGDRVVTTNAALATLLGRRLRDVPLARVIEEETSWLAERLPSALRSGESLRIHLRAGGQRVAIEVRVGRLECGAWVLVGRDATSVERVGALVGGLSSHYSRERSHSENIAAIAAHSRPLFEGLSWNVGVWVRDGDVVRLESVWLTEKARQHVSGFGEQVADTFMKAEIPLALLPPLEAAFREGRGTTLDELPTELDRVAEELSMNLPPVDRELMMELGFIKGALAPVFDGERVLRVIQVASGHFHERDAAGAQLFASVLSAILRANALGEVVARQERHAALGQMARQLAHEVRNPLAVILQACRQARQADPELAESMLDMIDEEAKRLERLMSDLVSFAGPLSLRLRSTPVGQLVDWSVEALDDAEACELVVEVDEGLMVYADPMLLRQALSHLLRNACSHAREEVQVLGSSSEDRVILRVRNDGGPMPEGVEDRVFEPFFTTRATGSGLGLAVVRRLIQDQGGKVELETSGESITFRVELPRG